MSLLRSWKLLMPNLKGLRKGLMHFLK
ncbi:hypothetical protein ACFX14_008157 [Malus domestica]